MYEKKQAENQGLPPVFFAELDKFIQYLYKIDKKCEKNNSILNKNLFNVMIERMNNLYSIYLLQRGNL